MDSIKPPESLKLTGNVDSNWRAFKQHFQLYIVAVGFESKPDARKVALLLTVAGPQAIEVYNTFVYDEPGDKDKFDIVMGKFDAHCSPKKNETYERYIFRSRIQQSCESFDSFLTDLKLKAQTCNFATLRDSMIRDQIVFGVVDRKVRERLLRETDLTLEGAIRICQACDLSQQHVKSFSETGAIAIGDSATVGAVSSQRGKRILPRSDSRMLDCKRCGLKHMPKKCPAYGKICSACHGKNHFAKRCFSKGKENKTK